MHWAEAVIAGITGALTLTIGRLRRSFDRLVVYVPFYAAARGWWREDARPWLAICAALLAIVVLPKLRRASVPRPVLWSALGVVLASLAGGVLGAVFGIDPTPLIQAGAVAATGFAVYLGSVTLDVNLRSRLSRVVGAALVLLLGATAWQARCVVAALRHGSTAAVLSRGRALNTRLRLPGVTLRLARAEVTSLLGMGALDRARSVTEDLVETYPNQPGLAVLRARVLQRLEDPGGLTWLASAARGPLSVQDRKYVASGLIRAGWVGPWADAWQRMSSAAEELSTDSSYVFRLAVALRLRGRHGDALELLAHLRGRVPEGWRAYEMGRIAEDRGDAVEARRWYARSDREADTPPDARRRLRQDGESSSSGPVLGDVVRLSSWDLDPTTVAPGEQLRIVLVVQVLEFAPEDYRFFLHFEESLHPQHRFYGDHDPQGGARPSISWLPGEVLADTSWVAVPLQAARGTYRVRAGLFVPLGSKPRLGDLGHDRIDIGWLRIIERAERGAEAIFEGEGP